MTVGFNPKNVGSSPPPADLDRGEVKVEELPGGLIRSLGGEVRYDD